MFPGDAQGPVTLTVQGSTETGRRTAPSPTQLLPTRVETIQGRSQHARKSAHTESNQLRFDYSYVIASVRRDGRLYGGGIMKITLRSRESLDKKAIRSKNTNLDAFSRIYT